jgi:SAM-dependent methyltransferase
VVGIMGKPEVAVKTPASRCPRPAGAARAGEEIAVSTHQERILDQFTRQAVPFASAPGIRAEEGLRVIVEATGAGPRDTALDVACGPGLLVCAFARVARHATGIDVTPAMLDQARAEAARQGLANVSWDLGDGTRLPYADGQFTVVTSRFAFHHIEDPAAVLREMRRVCAPGGRIAVADAAPSPETADAFNAMEVLRDPSHVRALPPAELEALFPAAGLGAPRTAAYRLETDVDGLLSRSFPDAGDEARLRRIFEDALVEDRLGMGVRREGTQLRCSYPLALLVATR